MTFKIGILALQGDFARHQKVIAKLGHKAIEVRQPHQLTQTDALIIPGGESTTLLKLFKPAQFSDHLRQFAKDKPILGTCAGLILLAREADRLPDPPLGLIDISARRNAYGRQRESFVASIALYLNGKKDTFSGVFIRAPKIEHLGPGVEILAKHGDDAVMVAQNNILVCTFHPELTDDLRIHDYFIKHFVAS